MIIKRLAELAGTDRDVQAENWASRRLLLKKDGMGFSLHDTVIHAGTSTEIHYRHHLEAVYCIQGKGTVYVPATGTTYEIEAGTVYALNGHEQHVLSAEVEMRMVCVFNPPLVGTEVHDAHGVYPLLSEG